MKTKIAKDFYWEMSHRLPYHNGPCRNIHGHSYKLRVEISGEPKDDGMLLDYYDLKILIMPIVEMLDHCFVVDKDDNVMIDFLKANEFKHHILDTFTTAENLTAYIFGLIKTELKANYPQITELNIRLYETQDVFAEICAGI
jgi:6-pyruvoyltetrahydropterin/6-carboxytetrahydropterin synthase